MNTFTWFFVPSRAQMFPSRTKYGWRVRLMVSVTSRSAAWTRSRTFRQMSCCQSGRDSMYASTRGSVGYPVIRRTVRDEGMADEPHPPSRETQAFERRRISVRNLLEVFG